MQRTAGSSSWRKIKTRRVQDETFEADRRGTYTTTKDPTRDNGLCMLMDPFSKYNKDNVDKAVSP